MRKLTKNVISIACGVALVAATAVPCGLPYAYAGQVKQAAQAANVADDTDFSVCAALPGVPQEGDDDAQAQGGAMSALAAKSTDINAKWTTQDGGTTNPYVIKSAGTYKLSADLSVESQIKVDAAGKDVVIDLGTSVLSVSTPSSVIPIELVAAKSVTIRGSFSTMSTAQLSFKAQSFPHIIESKVDSLVIDDLGISGTVTDENVKIANIGFVGVYVSSGKLSMSNCSIALDQSNQTRCTYDGTRLKGVPCGVYLAEEAQASSIDNCTVQICGSPYAEPEVDSQSVYSVGHAFGIYSVSKNALSLGDCNINVQLKRGVATCVYAANAKLAASKTLDASAQGYCGSFGVWSGAAGGVSLGGKVAFSCPKTDETQVSAALYAQQEGAFVFAAGFAGSALSAAIEQDGRFNEDSWVIGTGSVDAGVVANALGSDAPCDVAASDGKLQFSLAQERAAAQVEGGNRYSSLQAALDAAGDGATVMMLKDADTASVDASGSLTLDLAGHTLGHLEITRASSLSLTSTGNERGRICTTDQNYESALLCKADADVSITSIDIVKTSTSGAAYGIQMNSGKSLVLNDVNIEVTSQRGDATSIEVSSAAAVTASGGSVSCMTSAANAKAIGVNGPAAGGSLELADCNINIMGSNGSTGGVTASCDVSYSGSMSVASSADASQVWGVRLEKDGLTGKIGAGSVNVAGYAASPTGSYSCFAAGTPSSPRDVTWDVSGSCKTTCELGSAYSQSAKSSGGAVNKTTGQTYSSLAEALAAANDGDTVALSSDCVVVGGVSISKAVTLDLAGHELDIDSGGTSAAPSNAISVEASGNVSITSSAGNAKLRITLGRNAETSSSSENGYNGIAQTGTGTLTIGNVDCLVTYTGSSSSKPQFSLAGLYAASGSAVLASSAKLTVNAAKKSGAFGATTVKGIQAGDNAVSIEVASGAKVSVNANAMTLTAGAVTNNSLVNAVSTDQYLMQIYPDEGSDLYKQVLEQFRLKAQLDVKAETSSYAYGASVYYLAPLTMDDGSLLWAFSDAVETNAIGTKESVTPRYFFVQATYQVPSKAVGVASSEASKASVNVQGSVQAISEQGDAAVAAVGDGVAFVAGGSAALSAGVKGDSYRKVCGELCLSKKLGGVEALKDNAFYPTTVTPQEVKQASVEAVGVTRLDGSAVEGASNAELNAPNAAQGASPNSIAAGYGSELAMNAYGACTDSGTFKAASTATWSSEESLDAALKDAQQPKDFTSVLGTRYVFVGWNLNFSDDIQRVMSSQGVSEQTLNSLLQINRGSINAYASYVAVPKGCSLVQFNVGKFSNCAVAKKGEQPSYKSISSSQTMVTPILIPTPTGASALFTGWDDGSTVRDFLPAATGDDIIVTAKFEQVPNNLTLKWSAWFSATSGVVYQTVSRTAKAGTSLESQANGIAKSGDVVYGADATYEFLGWGTRSTDVEPMFTSGLPAVYSSLSFYGIYKSKQRTVKVDFYSNGEFYATAGELPASTTLEDAWAQTKEETPYTTDAENPFRGWDTVEGSHSPQQESMVTVGSLASNGDSLKLYAVFGYDRATVTFVDSDGTTVIATVDAIVGQTLASIDKTVTVDASKQKEFKRWKLADGSTFSMTETVIDTACTVTAVYKGDEASKTIDKNKGSDSKKNSASKGSLNKKSSGIHGASKGHALPSAGHGALAKKDSGKLKAAKKTSSHVNASNTPAAQDMSQAQNAYSADAVQDTGADQQNQTPLIPVLALIAAILFFLWRILALLSKRDQRKEAFAGDNIADGEKMDF